MRHHRFIFPFDPSAKTIRIDDRELLNQWLNVFRFKVGDELIICDGKGHESLVTLIETGKKTATIAIQKTLEPFPEPERKITLCCAVLKREHFELVVQKAVELGITTIQPIRTERTIKLDVNLERAEKIIKEAAEQCGRAWLPTIEPIKSFEEALKLYPKAVFFDLGSTPFSSTDWKQRFSLFIGPEGGWSEQERKQAESAGLLIASLESFTLRGETAAIIASYRAVQGI